MVLPVMHLRADAATAFRLTALHSHDCTAKGSVGTSWSIAETGERAVSSAVAVPFGSHLGSCFGGASGLRSMGGETGRGASGASKQRRAETLREDQQCCFFPSRKSAATRAHASRVNIPAMSAGDRSQIRVPKFARRANSL